MKKLKLIIRFFILIIGHLIMSFFLKRKGHEFLFKVELLAIKKIFNL